MSSLLWFAAAASASTFTLKPSIDDMIAHEREAFGTDGTQRRGCPEAQGNEIVVCGKDYREEFRVPSDSDLGVVKDDIPPAPNVSGLPDCSQQSVCIGFGKKPRDPLIIDLKAIPEPPPGSDADLIARGLKRAP